MSNQPSNRRARFAVSAYFLAGGTATAVWGVHIPEVEKNLHIDHSVIGSIILLLGLGAFLAMQAMGWVIDHYGSKIVTSVGGVATGLALFLPAFAPNVLTLAIGMFILGASVGTLDVGMNASGVIVEARYGRSIFSSLHAMWSAGGILGAVIGGFALAVSSPMWLTLSVTGVVVAAVGLVLTSSLIADKPLAQPKGEAKTEGRRANREVLTVVLAIGVMACFAAIAEGSAVDWSALHLNTVLHATTAQAALGVGAFSTTMAITRLLGDKLVDRFGRINVVRYGSLIASAGIAVAVFAPAWQIAVIGWGVLGIGVSGVIPQLFIAAGNIGEETHKGRNMAKVFGLTYFGIMAGPAVIGFLTNWIPLNLALALGAVLCLSVAASASILKSKKFR